jgi:hypothetical protein
MAFCGSCGAQLEEGTRFCVQCGADQTAKAGGAPAAAPAAAPVAIPPQPAPPVAGLPPQYPSVPGQIPIMMPPQPAKGNGWLWGLLIAAAVVGGIYYNHTNNPPDQQNPGPGPTPQQQQQQQQQQPEQQQQPGEQLQPGNYQQQPGSNQQQPGGQGGASQALVQQQQFAGRWDPVNGNIQISQAKWGNGSNEAMQSATLECGQFAQNGQMITHSQKTLNGPVPPGQIVTFPVFQMGQLVQGVAKVQCAIVAVTPAQ